MAEIFLVAGAAQAALVRKAVGSAARVVNKPLLATGSGGEQRLTPDGESLLAELDGFESIQVAFDGGNPGDRVAAAIALAARQRGFALDRFLRLIPSAWTVDELVAAKEAAVPLAEYVGPILVRQRFARHLGRHLRRLLGTIHGPQGLQLSPESLVILFLLANRQTEISMFGMPAGRTVVCELDGRSGGEARLCLDGDPLAAEEAARLAAGLDGAAGRVTAVEEAPLELPPPEPYGFAELVADAWRLLHRSPGAVVAACRRLLASEMPDGSVRALISSPWSVAPPPLAVVEELVRVAGGPAGPRDLPAGSILPLDPSVEPDALDGDLDTDALGVYRLIHKRALAACSRPATGVQQRVFVECEGRRFEIRRRQYRDAGFLAYIEHGEPQPAAPLAVGDIVTLVRGGVIEAEPPVVTEHDCVSLAEELRDFSISFDAATALLLQEMHDRGYVEFSDAGTIRPAANCDKVVRTLDRAFPSMRGINLSAYIEQTIVEVVSGRKELEFALHQFDATLQRQGKVLVAPKIGDLLRRRRRSASLIKGEELAAVPEESHPADDRDAVAPDEGQPAPPAPSPDEEARKEMVLEPQPVAETDADTVADAVTIPAAEEISGPAVEETPQPAPEEIPEPVAEEASQPETPEAPPVVDEAVTETEPLPFESMPEPPVAEPATKPSPTVQTRPCPACGRPMVLGRDRFGEFWKCTGFPACRYQEGVKAAGEHLVCPLCTTGEILVKATPSGKSLYVCSRPECRFMAWGRPHAEPCPVCGSPYLVEKKTASGGMELRCPRAGCRYRRGFAAAESSAAPVVDAVAAAPSPAGGDGAGTTTAMPVKKKRRIRVVRRKKK